MDTLFQIFNNYGWPGLIAICFLFIIYILFKLQSNSINLGMNHIADKITDGMANLNLALVNTIIDSQSKMLDYVINGKEKDHKSSIAKRLKIGEELKDLVKEICNKYRCNRTCILELHNNKENIDGLAFVWYDILYEWQDKGIDPISEKCKNLQAVNILPVIKESKETGYVWWNKDDLDKLYDKSSVLYNYLVHKANCQEIIYFALYNSHTNQLIGFLCLEYSEPTVENLIDLDDIENYAIKISTILSVKS